MMTMDNNRVATVFLGILALIAVGTVFKMARSVVLPLTIAWLLSFMLGPLVRSMARRGIPVSLGILIVLLLLLGVCFLAGYMVNEGVSGFAAAYPRYRARMTTIFDTFTQDVKLPPGLFKNIDFGDKLGTFIVRLSGSFVTFGSNLVLVMIFLVFMLLGKPYSRYKIERAFSPERAVRMRGMMEGITDQIRRYLVVQFFISLITGALVWLVLAWIGVDFAFTWGALTFFLNFIPTIGSVIASIPPILVAVVQFYPEPWPAVLCAAAVLVIQQVTGNVLSPRMMGKSLNMSPVTILLALLFWGWLWGVVGALLSIPMTAAIKIVCENVEGLRPISILMESGKGYKRTG